MKKIEKRKAKKQNRGIIDFMIVTNHFFHKLSGWISQMDDPRDPSYITYSQTDLNYMVILKNVCGQHSMREMDENFNKGICIDTLRVLSGHRTLEEMPHYDTLNYYLEGLSPECLSELRRKMVTGLSCFKEKHCENCVCTKRLTEDVKKEKLYYHNVLEAKIVLGDSIVVSLGTEFIENEKEDVKKQDCETNAAKRLVERIKKDYPRLPVCMQGDALYAAVPMMKLYREKYHWEYIFTQKDTRQKLVDEGFE